jgi:hypothetical protein
LDQGDDRARMKRTIEAALTQLDAAADGSLPSVMSY